MASPTWNKHHRAAWERLAVDAGDQLDLTTRILLVAQGRLARSGHAAFRRAEMSRLLGSVAPGTGELTPVHRNSIRKAIDKGIAVGVFASGSTSECIRIPHYLTTHDAGKDLDCPTCTRPKARNARPQRALAPPQDA